MSIINFPTSPVSGQTYIFNGTTWTYNGYAWIALGIPGPTGDSGPSGVGIQGPTGATGIGVISGGATGQILSKSSSVDYDTAWVDGYTFSSVFKQVQRTAFLKI